MSLLSTLDQAKRQPQLTRDHWIEAALLILVEEGIEAVQITTLSKGLEVTRGSFYWHFKNREELLDALLKEWRARNTGVIMDALSTPSTITDGVLNLFYIWVDHQRFDPELDQAVRDWARRSEPVREVLSIEDDSRVKAIAAFFERHGYGGNEAFVRARVIYFTQLSYYALGVRETMSERMSYLPAYFTCFTGLEIDASTVREFVDRLESGRSRT